jgi:hypothetical protein
VRGSLDFRNASANFLLNEWCVDHEAWSYLSHDGYTGLQTVSKNNNSFLNLPNLAMGSLYVLTSTMPTPSTLRDMFAFGPFWRSSGFLILT